MPLHVSRLLCVSVTWSSVCTADDLAFHFLQASDEVDSQGPRGFFQPVLGGWHTLKEYPTLITTQMSGDRARDALTYLSVRLLLHLAYALLSCTCLHHAVCSISPTSAAVLRAAEPELAEITDFFTCKRRDNQARPCRDLMQNITFVHV